jgi:hypothetical protein
MNKVTLLLAAALTLPTAALAQSAPPTPAVVTPAVPATAPAMPDMAKMKADMAKMQAAQKAARAKILAALTPAHKAYFANLVGQLAIAANPDPKAAVAKLDSVLTASEKSKIVAVQTGLMKSMMAAHHSMMAVRLIKDDDGTTTTTTQTGGPGDMAMGPGPGHTHKRHAPDAGRILFEMSGGGGMHPPMMMRVERFHRGGPGRPAPAPTPSS